MSNLASRCSTALLVAAIVSACEAGPGAVDDWRAAGCAVRVACMNRSSTMRGCVDAFEPEDVAQLRCYASANGSCEAAYACFGATVVADATCPMDPTPRCDGNTLLTCTLGFGEVMPYRARISCESRGNSCFTTASGASCAAGTCTMSGTRCEGADVVRCDGEVERREQCPEGSACDATAGGCRASGPACTDSRCERDVLVLCDGGREYRVDCTEYDQVCVASSGALGCEPPESECDDTFEERCVSGVWEFCGNANTIERFDCEAHGFAGCSGSPPHCVPNGFSYVGP